MTIEEYSAEIIMLILSMTFTGSMISCFLFILKPIIRDRLPKSFQYYMWLSALIGLVLPVSKIIVIPVSNDSIMPMKFTHDLAQWISDTASERPVSPGFALQNENGQIASQTAHLPSAAVILCVAWLSGMVLILGFHIISYASYLRKLGRHNISADWQEVELLNSLSERKSALRLYKNPMVVTPILIGFFRPAVILPDRKYEGMKLRNILMHETTHWKKHDILVKWLLIFAGSVHWFNPLVHIVRREMNRACELACDEAVIKKLDRSEMQQYGDALIAVAADSIKKIPLSIAMFEDKKNLKERLRAIMKHKKHSKRAVIAASTVLVTAVCVILGISTLYGADGHDYMDNFSLQEQMQIREGKLKETIRNYDKENNLAVLVSINYMDSGEITNAYIFIISQEENPDPEMSSEIKALASKELGVDIPNIYLEYI